MYMPVEVDAMEHDPYGVEIALIDDLLPGEVVVLGCNGPTERIVPWGELLTTAAQQRGAAGCITDGLVRDVRQIRAMRFALFHGGISPLDSRGRGRMMTRDRPIVCGGVTIQPGDYIFGDVDGVVVIPRAALDETLQRSLAKVSGENQVRDALLGGMSLTDAFAKYGLL
jgi:regulator of RNase E activity RraA